LNPDSGPGTTPFPNGDFYPQIAKLNQYSNVEVVGYVHTSYASRNISAVLADVATYSGWAANSSSIALNGIFFDEAPSDYSQDASTYMATIDQAVKNAVGFRQKTVSNSTPTHFSCAITLHSFLHASPLLRGTKIILNTVSVYTNAHRLSQVIHNPGVIPDPRLNDSSADITVVFEGPYSDFLDQRSNLSALTLDRSRYSYIVHSVPGSLSVSALGSTIVPASQHANYLYFTYVGQDPYESFGPHWNDIINIMPT
jgi:hypothetical protein